MPERDEPPGWFRLLEVGAVLAILALLPDMDVLGDDQVMNYLLSLGCFAGIGLVFRNVLRGD